MLLAYNPRNPPAHYQPPNHWPTNRWQGTRIWCAGTTCCSRSLDSDHVGLQPEGSAMAAMASKPFRKQWIIILHFVRRRYTGYIIYIYIYIYTLYLSIYELFNCKVEFSKIILPNMNPMTTQSKNAMIEMSPCPFNLRRNLFTLPTTDIALKIALPKKKVVSQPEFFRGHRYVSFRECNIRSTQLSLPFQFHLIELRIVECSPLVFVSDWWLFEPCGDWRNSSAAIQLVVVVNVLTPREIKRNLKIT